MQADLVSVIIPVYNEERYLAATIRSALAQSYRPMEIIVIDDGSEDGSAEIARRFSAVRYVYQKNQGLPAARNAGIEHAQGEFIAYLDADDLWMPEKLTLQVRLLRERPELGYVFTRQRIFLDAGVERPSWLKPELLEEDTVAYVPSALLARRTVFEQVGKFDPHFDLGDDSDWFFRAHDAGIPMDVVPQVLLHKRVHNANMTRLAEQSQPQLLEVVRASIQRKRKGRA